MYRCVLYESESFCILLGSDVGSRKILTSANLVKSRHSRCKPADEPLRF